MIICIFGVAHASFAAEQDFNEREVVSLADLDWDSAEVGWGRPEKKAYHSFEKTYDKSLFAHAYSKYVYSLDGTWETFETVCGIRHDTIGVDAYQPASVVFVVKGDDKELFRSETIRMNAVKELSLDIRRVKKFELIVEDGGNGNHSDHGVWFAPKLSRKTVSRTPQGKAKPKTKESPQSPMKETADIPPIRVVYFVPADRQPFPDAPERLGRVMLCVREFFRKEMIRNGFGSKTFALEWGAPGKLKLHVVKGEKGTRAYDRNGGSGNFHEETRSALRKQGIDPNREVVLVFSQLLIWEGNKAIELGAYVGGGGHFSGLASVYDDPHLDPLLLPSKMPGGYYGGPCSWGEFNSHYIGGVAHELGHALGLPHGGETQWEKENLGTSLMGGGNHTFGQELRGEGRGTFLAKVAALRLSRIRAFAGESTANRDPAVWTIEQMNATFKPIPGSQAKGIEIVGKVSATPPLVGIGVYNEDETLGKGSSYNAKTWAIPVGKDGRFRCLMTDLKSVPYTCRFCGIHENGACSEISLHYSLANVSESTLDEFNLVAPLDRLRKAFREKDRDAIQRVPKEFTKLKSVNVQKLADFLCSLLEPEKLVEVAKLPGNVKIVDLSSAAFLDEKTEWEPLRRRWIPGFVFIRIDNRFFNSGLFAHARSLLKVDLGGAWQDFEFGYGIQDACGGCVRFIVRGDGRELFRSEPVDDHRYRQSSVSVKNVQTLELIVEPAEGGGVGWTVWTNTQLKR